MLKVEEEIVIVDDSEMNRAILKEIFSPKYKIVEFDDGENVADYVRENEDKILAILLDIVMPVVNGLEVIKIMRAKKIGRDIPIFLVTADNSTDQMVEAYELGVKDIIGKPFVPYFLQRRIENVLELYKLQKKYKNLVVKQAQIIEEKVSEIKELNNSIVSALALAIEFRSEETGEHVHNIRDLTYRLLVELRDKNIYPELREHDLNIIADASMLHDIGKIWVPDSILKKQGRLTLEEFEIMKIHSLKGAEIIERIPNMLDRPLFKYAYDICRHHHERWDGKGYPDKISGDSISIWAQVVSIADVYDALVSQRCYKSSFSKEKAIEMIKNGECGIFNPKLLEVFIELLDK